MKKLAVLFTLMMCTVLIAQQTEKKSGPPEGKSAVGDFYGANVSASAEKNAVLPEILDQKLTASPNVANTAVKAKVLEVCDKKGCWLTLETANDEKFFVKMKDYAFFVPTALKGKNVILEGSAERKIISVEEQKHYAEDAKKSQAEIDAITEPKQEIRFIATGIKVID